MLVFAMSFLDKLLFWKKDESLPDLDLPDLPAGPEQPMQAPGQQMGRMQSAMPDVQNQYPEVEGFNQQPSAPSFDRPSQTVDRSPAGRDDFSLVSAKLDTIKAQLDSVLQRLDRIEYGERSYQKRWR